LSTGIPACHRHPVGSSVARWWQSYMRNARSPGVLPGDYWWRCTVVHHVANQDGNADSRRRGLGVNATCPACFNLTSGAAAVARPRISVVTGFLRELEAVSANRRAGTVGTDWLKRTGRRATVVGYQIPIIALLRTFDCLIAADRFFGRLALLWGKPNRLRAGTCWSNHPPTSRYHRHSLPYRPQCRLRRPPHGKQRPRQGIPNRVRGSKSSNNRRRRLRCRRRKFPHR